MTKIDINKVKVGDQVQVANGDWYEVERGLTGKLIISWNPMMGAPIEDIPLKYFITAHKPAAAPEPVWVTVEQVADAIHSVRTSTKQIAEHLNRILTSNYGPPPIIKTATGEEEGSDWVLCYYKPLDYWDTVRRGKLEPGDRYVELPKCCGEGEA